MRSPRWRWSGRVSAGRTSTPFAVTAGPGLIGALLVGVCWAKASAWARDLPVIGVHHMEAHLFAPLLEQPDLELSVRRAARVGWSHAAHRRAGMGSIHPVGEHARRRGGRSLRQGRQAAGASVSGRPGHRAVGAGRQGGPRSVSTAHAAVRARPRAPGLSRFFLFPASRRRWLPSYIGSGPRPLRIEWPTWRRRFRRRPSTCSWRRWPEPWL